MAEFAELDQNNFVIRLVVVDDAEIQDELGTNNENRGIDYCNNLFGPSKWIQTFRDGSFRLRQADIGGYYNETANIFVNKKPYPSWLLNENFEWIPPVPKPEENPHLYFWDEVSLTWELMIQSSK